MNLNMIQPNNETEDLLLSITKNGETLIQKPHTKSHEALEIEKLVIFHTQKSRMRLKEIWIFQILQLPICKMI